MADLTSTITSWGVIIAATVALTYYYKPDLFTKLFPSPQPVTLKEETVKKNIKKKAAPKTVVKDSVAASTPKDLKADLQPNVDNSMSDRKLAAELRKTQSGKDLKSL